MSFRVEVQRVRGRVERFRNGLWDNIQLLEGIEVVEIGTHAGYQYALLVESDLPVRWATGEGAFGTTIEYEELMANLA